MMRVGEIFRYSKPMNPEPATVDGYPNFFHATHLEHRPKVLLERGINAVGKFKTSEEEEGFRFPAILLSSSPHMIGTDSTPWQDFHEPDHGYVRYYGDARHAGEDPTVRPGNKALLNAKLMSDSSDPDVRNASPPIIVFRRERDAKRQKGLPSFQGFGVVERAELISQFNTQTGYSFPNFVFDIAIFSMSNEGEVFDWNWINLRRDPSCALQSSLRAAPASWRKWVSRGYQSVPTVRRRVSKLMVRKTEDQRAVLGSKEASAVSEIYEFYRHRKARFELLAGMIVERILERQTGDCELSWLTRPSSDGGADFVCRLELGEGFSSLRQVVFGQAKCEAPTGTTSGRDVARTIARLRRGWVGAYVTLGAFSEPVQREVIEDEYPLLMAPGAKVGAEVMAMAHEAGHQSISEYLNQIVDPQYEKYIQDRKPEEVLKS